MATTFLYSIHRTACRSRQYFISQSNRINNAMDSHLAFHRNTSLVPLSFLSQAKWSTKGAGVKYTSYWTAGKSTAGRSRRGALLLAGAAAAVAGFVASVCHFQRAEMASRIPKTDEEEKDIAEKCKAFMSPPVTDIKVLQQRRGEMCTRMEMLIMETQAEFCKALEKVDGGTFKVDRWERKEGQWSLLPSGARYLRQIEANCTKVDHSSVDA